MSLREQQSLFTQYVGMLIRYALMQGYELTLGEGKLYAERRGYWTGKLLIFRDAMHKQTGKHYQGLAIDLNLFVNDKYVTDGNDNAWKVLGNYWKSLHPECTWGGDFGDANHFSWGEH